MPQALGKTNQSHVDPACRQVSHLKSVAETLVRQHRTTPFRFRFCPGFCLATGRIRPLAATLAFCNPPILGNTTHIQAIGRIVVGNDASQVLSVMPDVQTAGRLQQSIVFDSLCLLDSTSTHVHVYHTSCKDPQVCAYVDFAFAVALHSHGLYVRLLLLTCVSPLSPCHRLGAIFPKSKSRAGDTMGMCIHKSMCRRHCLLGNAGGSRHDLEISELWHIRQCKGAVR